MHSKKVHHILNLLSGFRVDDFIRWAKIPTGTCDEAELLWRSGILYRPAPAKYQV
jgi:hypothetical protein